MKNHQGIIGTTVSLFCIAIFLLFSPVVSAQTPAATLYGQVQDQTGAVLVGASVIAVHDNTALSRQAVTNEVGQFSIPLLPAGNYTLTVSMPGFKSHITHAVDLEVGVKSGINLVLT